VTEVTVPNRMAADRSIEDHFIQDVLEYMRREIRSSKDREVFFVCNTDLNGMVQSANVEARGNAHAVPAIVDRCLPHDVVVHNHPGGNLSPSDADLSVASHLGNSSVGFYIINNEVDDLYVVVEPFPRSKASPRRIGDEMLGVFEVGGALPTLLPGFQSRPAQLDMARSVLDAFNESRVLTMEAGTGTGKSFAYLVPALSWAHKTGERVVISTNTISLQEQLLHKDIPLIKKALGIELDVELVKGRSNYVCKRKLDVVAREPNLFAGDDDRKILEDLLEWAGSSQDGTRSDLSFVPPFEVWDKIVSESDTTLGVRCEHYQDCFFNSARRRASKAKVLLVNHHLLCADLALRSGPSAGGVSFGLLPPHSRVVIDEAHNLEDVASSYFGSAVTLQGAIRLMSKIHREGRKGGGVLAMIKTKLRPGRGINDRLMDRIDAFHVPGLISLRGGIESFFSSVWQVLLRASRGSESDFGSSEGELKVRLTPAIHSMIHELGLDDELVDLAQQLNLLARDLIGLVEELRVLGND